MKFTFPPEYFVKMDLVSDKSLRFKYIGVSDLRKQTDTFIGEALNGYAMIFSRYVFYEALEKEELYGQWHVRGGSYEHGDDLYRLFVKAEFDDGFYTISYAIYKNGNICDLPIQAIPRKEVND